MKSIELVEPWTYRTPLVTVDYPAGTHQLGDDAYAAALATGAVSEMPITPGSPASPGSQSGAGAGAGKSGASEKERADGDGAATAGAPHGAGAAESGQ